MFYIYVETKLNANENCKHVLYLELQKKFFFTYKFPFFYPQGFAKVLLPAMFLPNHYHIESHMGLGEEVGS